MRISDWSSDVCSSDLLIPCLRRFEVASVGKAIGTDGTKLRQTKGLAIIFAYITASGPLGQSGAEIDSSWDQPNFPRLHVHFHKLGEEAQGDRKRVVSGKSVAVRVDLGGRRIVKKKNKQKNDDR